MLLLSIDTCGPLGTVALARLGGVDELTILGQTELPGKTYSAQLVPAIRHLLNHHNVTLTEIATIVVTNGPGSFTGIRIGLSTAKGLAEPTSIPILAVSRLVVLAHKTKTIAAALDASRGEFYFGDYSACSAQETLLDRDRLRQNDHFRLGVPRFSDRNDLRRRRIRHVEVLVHRHRRRRDRDRYR